MSISRASMFFLVAVALHVSGCMATIGAPPPGPVVSDAHQFETSPDEAVVYIIRGGGLGGAVMFTAAVDGKSKGIMPQHTYLAVRLAPAVHSISATSPENVSSVELNAEGGHSYYYVLKPRMGVVQARVELVELPEEKGQEMVLETPVQLPSPE